MPPAPESPDIYTHGHADSVLRSHRWRTAANSAAYLLPHLEPGMSLLDIGCGPGNITVDLARHVAPGRVLGADRSAEVITEATELADATRLVGEGTVEFRVGDAYGLDAADDTFDVVHAHQVLQHLTGPVSALREWRRVCRPGGIVAARDSDYAGFHWYPHDPMLDRWLSLYRGAAEANRAYPDAGRMLLSFAHAAGFSDVTATASVWCFATPADRAWWGGMWADRILTSALTSQLLASGVAQQELDEISAAWRRWAAHPDGWFVLPHGEIICRA